jgi:hypothetical protein
MKTRSAMYLRQLSDKVHAKLDSKATELGIAKWLLIEKILEDHLGIEDNELDLSKFLGINRNSARTGKPYKKKTVK